MKLSILAELDYDIPEYCDIELHLEAAIIPEQTVLSAHIDLPPLDHFARHNAHDGIGERIWMKMQGNLKVRYSATVETHRKTADFAQLEASATHLLPTEVAPYLHTSRFCPSNAFQHIVADAFGHLRDGARVWAMSEWIRQNLQYDAGASNAETDAMDTYQARAGVCRDYAHLLISMARASAIPARFVAVYGLGVKPQDFHAVAEVFLSGAWHMIDPTGMSQPHTMAKIGVGYDASDVSFLTSYGPALMNSQSIHVSAA